MPRDVAQPDPPGGARDDFAALKRKRDDFNNTRRYPQQQQHQQAEDRSPQVKRRAISNSTVNSTPSLLGLAPNFALNLAARNYAQQQQQFQHQVFSTTPTILPNPQVAMNALLPHLPNLSETNNNAVPLQTAQQPLIYFDPLQFYLQNQRF